MSATPGTAPARLRGTAAALSFAIWVGTAGCGQSGPLVLPEAAAPAGAQSGSGAASDGAEETEDTEDEDTDTENTE